MPLGKCRLSRWQTSPRYTRRILRGGESGTAVIAGNPESSLILQAIRHDGIEMPPDTRLPETVVKDFERWIQDGAEDPRLKAPENPAPEHQQAAHRLTESGSQHWSFMPRLNPSIPHVKNTDWVKNSIDFFTLSAMEKSDIQPTQDAPQEPYSDDCTLTSQDCHPPFNKSKISSKRTGRIVIKRSQMSSTNNLLARSLEFAGDDIGSMLLDTVNQTGMMASVGMQASHMLGGTGTM